MTVTVSQPTFLPWAGFWGRAIASDRVVLLDNVQFPLGSSWVYRNRIKTERGSHWLAVPVFRKGRSYYEIRDVEIDDGREWRKKHLETIRRAYSKAPYFDDYFPELERVYHREWRFLVDLNVELLRILGDWLSVQSEFVLASSLVSGGKGTELLVRLLNSEGAESLLVPSPGLKYLDLEYLHDSGIDVRAHRFRLPEYPQLKGEFIPNLSVVDLLFNCGTKSREIIVSSGRIGPIR